MRPRATDVPDLLRATSARIDREALHHLAAAHAHQRAVLQQVPSVTGITTAAIPDIGDPTTPLKGAMDGVRQATSGLADAAAPLKNIFG